MCHVLIIEDEALIALDLQDLLEGAGATSIAIAETQDDAVAAARTRRPDMIMADVHLREGTGPQAVATITHEMGPVPVLFITATPEACHLCAPAARILRKPVDHSSVIAAFEEFVAPFRQAVER